MGIRGLFRNDDREGSGIRPIGQTKGRGHDDEFEKPIQPDRCLDVPIRPWDPPNSRGKVVKLGAGEVLKFGSSLVRESGKRGWVREGAAKRCGLNRAEEIVKIRTL